MPGSKIKPLKFEDSGLNRNEWNILKKLSSPVKIQDFLNSVPFNFEKRGETHHSVKFTLKNGQAHCFEGALIAGAALWIHGQRPLLLDLVTIRPDFDHVVALFKEDKHWGAISKTNHAVLRYREPIFKNVRELALSYFHEYFLPDGKKSLKTFSEPFDLSKLGTFWIATHDNMASVAELLDQSPHTQILSAKQTRKLRKADQIEIRAADLVEFKK